MQSGVTIPAQIEDLSFSIVAVDAYHLVVADKSYWEDYKRSDRVSTGRFLLKPGWRTVYGRHVETALVKVTLSDGTTGWGEATEPICPEVICTLAANLIAPVLGGTSWSDPAAFWAAGYDLNRCRGHHSGYQLHALAALDVAIWDALGRRAGKPVARLLAAEPIGELETYLSGLRMGLLEERVELAARTVAEGVTGIKLFVNADTDMTIREVAALRAAVPGDWKLMVDALWCYERTEDAMNASRRLAQYGVHWLECPIVPEDLEGHMELRHGSVTPVALGEHFFTHFQSASWFRAQALDVFQPDICRTGLSNGLLQAGLAREAGIRLTPHMGSGSPIVQAAALQFAAACRADEPCEYQAGLTDLLPSAFRSAWKRENGRLRLPGAAGLGVDVDEKTVAASSPTVARWRIGHD